MNTNLKNKATLALLVAMLILSPLCNINAQSSEDEFGLWTTFEASKKINKKLKLEFEAELRTIDGIKEIDRVSVGAGASYKLKKWLKASAGYVFIYSHKLDSKNIKDVIDEENGIHEYNIDHSYWTERNRFHITLSGDYKIGRVELSLRERVQYTRTNSATTSETKYRWEYTDIIENVGDYISETGPEFKNTKEDTTLRSRLSAKWDISKCKITPFASVELYTRLDEWKGCDKLRYRIGASYKINKKNSVSMFYLYQNTHDDDEPKGHAIGLGYSLDL